MVREIAGDLCRIHKRGSALLIPNRTFIGSFAWHRTARGAHIETHDLTPHPAGIERHSGAHIVTDGLTTSNIETHSRIHIYRHRASETSAHLVPKAASLPAQQISTLVYAYVVDCAPASPYAYSSSTHRFPDERTPIEATPLSATSAERGLGLGLGLGLAHFSSRALPFFSPPSFHTLSLFSAFSSVWWSD